MIINKEEFYKLIVDVIVNGERTKEQTDKLRDQHRMLVRAQCRNYPSYYFSVTEASVSRTKELDAFAEEAYAHFCTKGLAPGGELSIFEYVVNRYQNEKHVVPSALYSGSHSFLKRFMHQRAHALGGLRYLCHRSIWRSLDGCIRTNLRARKLKELRSRGLRRIGLPEWPDQVWDLLIPPDFSGILLSTHAKHWVTWQNIQEILECTKAPLTHKQLTQPFEQKYCVEVDSSINDDEKKVTLELEKIGHDDDLLGALSLKEDMQRFVTEFYGNLTEEEQRILCASYGIENGKLTQRSRQEVATILGMRKNTAIKKRIATLRRLALATQKTFADLKDKSQIYDQWIKELEKFCRRNGYDKSAC